MNQLITWQEQDLFLSINLQPRAAKDEFMQTKDALLKIRITAAPIENAANQHLIKFVAKEFGVTQAQVTIVKGLRSRKKLLRINKPRKLPPCLNFLYAAKPK
jgi:uncharacterized protein (TIGR00251 family)